MEDLVNSLSGGETSEYQRRILMSPLAKYIYTFKSIRNVFNNTGLEDPKTRIFLLRIQDLMKEEIVCLEAYPAKGRKGTGYKVVPLDKMDMNGEPMRRVIAKYGLPNKGYRHCTRESKITPFHAWCKDNLSENYVTAVGIRSDEIDRQSKNAVKNRIIYPLVRYEITKPIVNSYFEKQPFRLEIPSFLGNCQGCYKKSDKKLSQVYDHDKKIFDFWREMERDYYHIRAPRKIFRLDEQKKYPKGRTTDELISSFDRENDEDNGCGGSDYCGVGMGDE